MPESARFSADDPREWLNRARSDLNLAKSRPDGVLLDDLCYHTQQAAEKAIKAVLIDRRIDFPYIHDLAQLLALVESSGLEVPGDVRSSIGLTRFAVMGRYPGLLSPPDEEDYTEAVTSAERVVRWAESVVSQPSTG